MSSAVAQSSQRDRPTSADSPLPKRVTNAAMKLPTASPTDAKAMIAATVDSWTSRLGKLLGPQSGAFKPGTQAPPRSPRPN